MANFKAAKITLISNPSQPGGPMHQEFFRRFRWPFAGVAVAAIAAMSSLGALADSEAIVPEPPAMKVQAVMPGAWYVQGLPELGSSANQNFISNAGFVITADGWS